MNSFKKKGLTLIELIICLAIVMIVLTSIFSLNLFGIKSYKKTSYSSELQFEARLLSSKIADICRNRLAFNITDIPTSNPTDTKKYIYIKNSDPNIIYLRDLTGEKVLAKIEKGSFKIVFNSNNEKMLHYKITAQDGTDTYTITNGIELVNLSDNLSITSITFPDVQKALCIN